MVEIDKPPECLNYIEHNNEKVDKEYYALYYNNNIFGYLALTDFCIVHLQIHKWTPEIARFMKNNMHQFKKICRNKGCEQAVGINDDIYDERWPKMLEFLGFGKPITVSFSVLEV